MKPSPADYDSWYETPKGRWIGDAEFSLIWDMLSPEKGSAILDVGCGTGYFTRRFERMGLNTTGLDVDPSFAVYAKTKDAESTYLTGDALFLPFRDKSFDYCAAVTSLCFMREPARAVMEMTRVARRGVVVGLLNRRSLLCLLKRGKGSYEGARWDTAPEAREWIRGFGEGLETSVRSAVFIPSGSGFAKFMEKITPSSLPFGGFFGVSVKPASRS